jgi:hypothetical protein
VIAPAHRGLGPRQTSGHAFPGAGYGGQLEALPGGWPPAYYTPFGFEPGLDLLGPIEDDRALHAWGSVPGGTAGPSFANLPRAA